MNRKLLGTAIIAASATTLAGCGILETTLQNVEVPQLRFDSNQYIVQPGDTLNSVASRYKIDPDSLLTVNSLQLAQLIPGQRLMLLRDDESNYPIIDRNDESRTGGVSIGGAQASGVGQAIVLPNATQRVITRPVPADNRIITTDVRAALEEREQIVDVVNVAESDALLDPVILPEPVTVAVAAEVERPQGRETIVQTVNYNNSSAALAPAEIPLAASMEISDANAETTARRVTVKRDSRGGWGWPVLGTITQDFDLREINRQGLDIDPGPDAVVQAAAAGEVVYSGRDLASYGNLVILRHENNFLSAYSKVGDIFVKENQKVNAGDLIASVDTGEAGSNEIHFEIRRNGEPVNPIDYLPAL